MMDINYELYKVFYHVATTLNFSEASKQLFISQSAVSQSIKTLERKLDQTLFIRSTKKVQLTPEGEILLRHIEPAMNLIQKGEAQLLDAASTGGQIRIGASDTICRYFLVPYLEKFHKTFPNVHIKVINQTSLRCTELLKNGLVDLIVVNYPNAALNNISASMKIKNFHDVFIAGNNYPELREKKLTLADLLHYPILMLDKNSTTNEFIHRLFQQHQLDLVPEIELTSNDLLIDLARIGLGIAFIPDYCLSENNDGIFKLDMEEEMPERSLVIASFSVESESAVFSIASALLSCIVFSSKSALDTASSSFFLSSSESIVGIVLSDTSVVVLSVTCDISFAAAASSAFRFCSAFLFAIIFAICFLISISNVLQMAFPA